MKYLLTLLLLTSTPILWGQTRPATQKKPAAHSAKPHATAPVVPTAALAELGRSLRAECADGGNDYIRAFVYRAYMSQGARYRYQVEEQLGKLASSKTSRDTILKACCDRSGGDEAELTDLFYTSLHVSLTSAKALARYTRRTYYTPPAPATTPTDSTAG